jgi:hypothetical protein
VEQKDGEKKVVEVRRRTTGREEKKQQTKIRSPFSAFFQLKFRQRVCILSLFEEPRILPMFLAYC